MEKLQGYSMKHKKKMDFVDPVIIKNSKGGYMVQGTTVEGNKMSAIISKENAEIAIAKGLARRG